jgi:hypothetical protein
MAHGFNNTYLSFLSSNTSKNKTVSFLLSVTFQSPMLHFRKYSPSLIYIILFLALFLASIYLKFNDNTFVRTFLPDFREKVLYRNHFMNNSSNGYLHVRLNLTSNTASCQTNDNIIIYILSTTTNFQRRKVIRSTWASPLIGTCFVFILGKIDFSPSNQMRINNEKRQYKDIVQIDHMETYSNVVYKEIAVLQWSHHFYPLIPYLFKTDDDLIIDSILISSIARLLVTNSSDNTSYISNYRSTLISTILSSDRSTFFRGGWSMDFQPTLRGDGKFGVSKAVWPHAILPLYCSGFGWFMSNNVRDRLVNASYTYPLNRTAWIGDVFVSGFLARQAKVKCTGIEIDYEQTFSGNCSCLMVKNPMLTVCSSTFHAGGGGGGDEVKKYEEYKRAWKIIRQRQKSMNMTFRDC